MKNLLGRLIDDRQNNPSSCAFLPERGEWRLRAFLLAVFGRLAKEDPSACDREKIELEGKTGLRRDGEIGVWSQSDFETPVPHAVRHYPPLLESEIEQAASLAAALETVVADTSRSHWRFFRALTLYVETRSIRDNMERLHQYCRCIEGLIMAEPGKALKQFKSRTELFIGPRHHDLMGEMYEVRSVVEHLHEHRYLETFDREVMLGLCARRSLSSISPARLSRGSRETTQSSSILPTRQRLGRSGHSRRKSGVGFGVTPSIPTTRLQAMIQGIFRMASSAGPDILGGTSSTPPSRARRQHPPPRR